MGGKAGASGRRPVAAPKKHVVSGRLNEREYVIFCEMRQDEAALLRAKGIDLTESDFLRSLIFEGAERRGKTMIAERPPASSPSPSNGASPAARPKKSAAKGRARP